MCFWMNGMPSYTARQQWIIIILMAHVMEATRYDGGYNGNIIILC